MSLLPEGLPAPAPQPDGLDRPYWDAARRHRLMAQRCNACGAWQWAPEWICHACRSFEIGWAEVPGNGRIFSWQRVWHPVHPALVGAVPYVVVLVELPGADGIRMIGNLAGDPRAPVEIGAEVEPLFEDHAQHTLVQWRRTP
ncbi:MAG TPA: OB-fold domain-containing protein [Myxococcota bacterium]|nr:OB-fold domain-containing protein [Myxococcota bacterium]